jgi:hypothetical protein
MATHHCSDPTLSLSPPCYNATTVTPDGAQKANTMLRWNKRLYHSGGSNYTHFEPRAILLDDAVIDAIAVSLTLVNTPKFMYKKWKPRTKPSPIPSAYVTPRNLNPALLVSCSDVHDGTPIARK